MAIIHPYADPSAHGKVTPGLMFKRQGPRVIFGAVPRPRDKKSAAQLLQRNKIREAVTKYKILNYEELIFLRRRGSMLSKNPYQLYTSSQLKGNDWSKTPGHQLNTINNIVIFDRQQDDPNDMRFSLKSANTQTIINNTKLYNKLDSETAGVVSSDIGPDLTWTGTPTHTPLKFDDGAFSLADGNNIKSNDNGQFFKDTIESFMFSTWVESDGDIVNGIPTSGKSLIMFEWRGSISPSNTNFATFLFAPPRGLYFQTVVNGVATYYKSTDPRITFSAGEKRYVSLVYVRNGIDGGPAKVKLYFGTDEDLYEVESSTIASPLWTASSTSFTLLSNSIGTNPFRGGLDNVKIVTVTKQAEIDELNNTRSVEQFETELGYVFDNMNMFIPGTPVNFIPELHLIIESLAALDWAVPFYWALAITWSNDSITERTTLIRLPKIVVNSSEAIILYLSTDMSNYFDEKLFRLGATDNV
ncbi:hypothetical protein KAR91_12305 [Candidatus Pacearchaeota archaeon]|nr:hypothetical protein [Candidatus Pacearchaeota archaeon]